MNAKINNTDNIEEIEYGDYKGFEQIGYHRILGNGYFNMIYSIILLFFAIATQALIPVESWGISQVIASLFLSIYTFCDFGLNQSLARFIAEYRVKDLERTKQYIRLFIWFQAFSGLGQITVISVVAMFFFNETNYEFMIWLFLFYSLIQYPGWLSVFSEALKGFQRFNKVTRIGIASALFQIFTYLLCSQIGLYYGKANPAIGPIMGCAIGIIIGSFVDDFLKLLFSAKLFSDVAKEMGFEFRELFVLDISREVFTESLKYGVGVMGFIFSYQVFDSIIMIILINYLPGYTSLVGILFFIQSLVLLSELMVYTFVFNATPAISEGYFNNKEKYTKWTISNTLRTIGRYNAMFLPIIIVISPGLYKSLWPQNYAIFVEVFFVIIIRTISFQHTSINTPIYFGTGHLKANVIITLIESIIQFTGVLILINLNMGIWVLIWPNLIAIWFKMSASYIYIHFKVMKFKINIWQTWVSTFLAGAVYTVILFVSTTICNIFLGAFLGPLLIYGLFFVLAIFLLPGPFFFFFWGLFGGFDANTLRDFERAKELAGSAKRMARSWYKYAALGSSKSKLFGKHPMDYEGVAKEINELMLIKMQTDEKLKSKA